MMLTFCWLDAECCLVQYERGRIQSEEVGMVFRRGDERDGVGVEQRSVVIFRFGERLTCGNTNYSLRIRKPASQQILPQSHKSPSGVDGNIGSQYGVNLPSVSWAGESQHDSSSS